MDREALTGAFTTRRITRMAGWSAALLLAMLIGRAVGPHVASAAPLSAKFVQSVPGFLVLSLYIIADYRRTRDMPIHATWATDITTVFVLCLLVGKVVIRLLGI